MKNDVIVQKLRNDARSDVRPQRKKTAIARKMPPDHNIRMFEQLVALAGLIRPLISRQCPER